MRRRNTKIWVGRTTYTEYLYDTLGFFKLCSNGFDYVIALNPIIFSPFTFAQLGIERHARTKDSDGTDFVTGTVIVQENF